MNEILKNIKISISGKAFRSLYHGLQHVCFCTWIFLLCFSVGTFAQVDPAYFVIGDKELANADVYSVLETSDERLLTATDRGVFEYKKGDFVLIENARLRQLRNR